MNNARKRTSVSFLLSVVLMASVLVGCLSLNAKAFPFVRDSFKVLSIGNSFSTNATTYLYELAEAAGLDNVVIGNLYIGGCDITTHWSNAKSNSAAYNYVKSKKEKNEKMQNVTMLKALLDEKWDYIVLQQASHYSGVDSTYNEELTALINYIKLFSPTSKLAWHMTWAYPEDSTAPKFSLYGNDTENMYYSIVAATVNKISVRDDISYIIPSGTVVRNLQTSYIRDNMFKDERHMNDLGCYAVGLAFIKTLTECNIEDITWTPSSKLVRFEYLNPIQEAVINADNTPFDVTKSLYKCNHNTSPSDVINTLITVPGMQATCKQSGLTDGLFCFGCDKFIVKQKKTSVSSHEYGDWVIYPAGLSKDGSKVRTCKGCGKTEKQTIAKINTIDVVSSKVYSGKVIKPEVIVTDSAGNKLKLNTDYTVRYPKAKQVGTYSVIIIFKGKYEGDVEKTFKIVPKAVSISSVEAGSKSIVINWKKPSMKVSGYELQYSTSKNFTDKKTKKIKVKDEKTLSKTVTKLKKDTRYYLRIRAYKTVDKTKYYSPWSNMVKIRTIK